MPSSSSACARRARSFSARRISANGPTFRSSRSSSGWSGRGGQTRNPYDLEPQPLRLELRIGRRHRRRPCRRRRGHRDGRLDRLPVRGQRHRRHQADGRAGQPQRHHSDLGQPGHGRADGPNRCGCGDAARCAGRHGFRRCCDRSVEDSCTCRASTRAFLNPTACAACGSASRAIWRVSTKASMPSWSRRSRALQAAGAVIVDPADLKLADTVGDDESTVLLYEFKDGLNRYLATRTGGPRTLAELIAFNESERAREMPYFGQEQFITRAGEGSADGARLSRSPQAIARCRRAERHRRRAQENQAGCHHRTHRRTGVDDGSGERGSLHRRQCVHGAGDRRISAHHRSCRLPARPAGRHLLHRHGVESTAL